MKTRHAKPRVIRLSSDGAPPSEFRLFPLGTIETTKGTFYLEAEDAQACLAAHAAYANDLSIDWGHGAFEEADGTPQAAAGWIGGLEVRGDGLYAVRVTWTETAAGMLKRREQRYFSPAFTTDADGHVRSIINCALTLIPATHGLIPLVASRAGNSGVAARKLSTMADKYCKASDLEKMADEIEKDEKASEGDKAMAARLRKLAEDSEELKLAEDDGDEPDGDEPEKTSDGDAPADDKKQASRIAKLCMAITGKKSASGVAGALQSLAENKSTVERLSAEVAKLTAGNRKAEVDALLSKGSRAGKVTPAMIKSGRLAKMGMADPKELEGYIDELPVLVSMNDGRPNETQAAQSGAALVKLSDDQKAILRKAGVNVSDEKAVVAFLNRAPAGAPAQLPRGSTRHGPHRRPPHR